MRVVRRETRGGKGAAIRTGVEAAARPWILFSDADFSIPIQEFENLWKEAERAPIVIGSKHAPGGHVEYPPLRRFLGSIGQRLIALFVVSGFHDTQCGFKLYRTDTARELFRYQRIDGFGFDFEVLFLAQARPSGHAVREVPIQCVHKLGGSVHWLAPPLGARRSGAGSAGTSGAGATPHIPDPRTSTPSAQRECSSQASSQPRSKPGAGRRAARL